MQNKFKLKINDLGPIKEANMGINQINIIGGPNASGKSFSSKLLFCFLTSLSEQGKRIENDGIYGSYDSFIKRWINNTSSIDSIQYNHAELNDKVSRLMQGWDDNNIDYDYLNDFLLKFKSILDEYDLLSDENCLNDFEIIRNTIDPDKQKFGYVPRVLNYLLLVEFGQSSLKQFQNAKIEFKGISDQLFNFSIDFNEYSADLTFNTLDDSQLNLNKVIYMDSISLLGFKIKLNKGIEVNGNLAPFHFYSLLKGMVQKPSINSVALNKFYANHGKNLESEFIEMMDGFFEFKEDEQEFIFKSNDLDIELNNVASGYKQIGIIQLLLSNKSISDGTWLIIDEPEVNLHPAMQIKLVELLVKMAQELNIAVYVNSHSPYIIEAFEVYSKRENMDEKTSFFLCEPDEKTKFNIHEVSRKNLRKIYDNLANPYNIINSVRFENDWKEEFD